jgi:glycosyltransferase involved in cell wall biosynthesis
VRVSLIIPAYNAQATIAECLDACANQSRPPDEVVVVDDGSTDGTKAVVSRYPVTCLHQDQRGPAAARNLGAKSATGDILVFTDSDCVPEPAWIGRLIDAFSDGRTVAAGGSYGIRNASSLLARVVHEEIAVRHARLPREVDFLGSFNVAYRRGAFLAAGGFDESFARASGEDNDLAYRLRDAGGVLRFVPEARVAHYHPAALWPYLRTQMRHGYWRMRLYAKHPGRSSGDDYAGLADFAGPPIVAAIVFAALIWAVSPNAAIAYAIVLLLVAYAIATARLTHAIVRRLGLGAALAYRAVATLRDGARALGLIGGVWTFVVLRKEAA